MSAMDDSEIVYIFTSLYNPIADAHFLETDKDIRSAECTPDILQSIFSW